MSNADLQRLLLSDADLSDAALAQDQLDQLNQLNVTLAENLDLDVLTQSIIETATRLTGAAYGAFFERVPVDDEAKPDVWKLASLAGAPREAFTRFGLPRPTALFGPTFRAEAVIRSADVLTDPRYGSMGGMPHGHLSVRSYMACAVVSRTAGVTGALLFGHPEPDRFTERDERFIVGFAGQTAVAIDNARLFRTLEAEIRERRSVEAGLRRSDQRFRAAIAAIRGVLWTNSADGRMHGEQPGWSALTGQSFEAYQDFGWADAIHPEDAAPTLAAWTEAVAARDDFRVRTSRAAAGRALRQLCRPGRSDRRGGDGRDPGMGRSPHRHHRTAAGRSPARSLARGCRGCQSGQEPVHRQHEPRAPHAPVGRHRL